MSVRSPSGQSTPLQFTLAGGVEGLPSGWEPVLSAASLTLSCWGSATICKAHPAECRAGSGRGMGGTRGSLSRTGSEREAALCGWFRVLLAFPTELWSPCALTQAAIGHDVGASEVFAVRCVGLSATGRAGCQSPSRGAGAQRAGGRVAPGAAREAGEDGHVWG